MKIQENVQLAPLTSFDVGGPAENLLTIESSHELAQALTHASGHETWMLGYGTNVLISDQGLDGYTLLFRNKNIEWQTNTVIVDAGVWWDDLVQQAIQRGFWGLELMSGVPGSVGAAIFINITAYGQSLSDKLVWVDYMDKNGRTERLDARSQSWGYKQSVFQQHQDWFIVKAAFELDTENRVELAYQSALDVAKDLNLSTDNLTNRRQIILEARDRAGSIFVPGQNYAKTVGSFFRNPMVTPAQAEEVAKFDETGKTKQQISQHGSCLLFPEYHRLPNPK